MKILFLPSYFTPEKAASLYIADNRYEAFANEGFDMVAYTPFPSRGLSQEDIARWRKVPKEVLYNGRMIVNRFPLSSESTSSIKRIVRYFVQNIKQYRWARKRKNIEGADIIFVASTPPLHGYMASCLSKRHGIPFVYNVQDVFPDSLVGTGMAKKGGLLWRWGNRLENKTYARAAKIVVISNDFKKNLITKGVQEEKIEVIYNWVDQNAVVDIPRDQNKLFDMYGIDRSKFYVTYNGNIGLTQNMEMLCEIARELESSHPDIHFVLVGNGAYWEALVEKQRGLRKEQRVKAPDGTEAITFGNITLLPFQPYEDIAYVFSLGDASLVISKPGVGENSVPSKTWSIMSASRPVLANFDENELKEIVTEHRCGIFTKAGDARAFKESILTLYNDRELCKEYGRNGRQFVIDNLTREMGTQKYVNVIKSVVNK